MFRCLEPVHQPFYLFIYFVIARQQFAHYYII